jgi:hypothetical protein
MTVISIKNHRPPAKGQTTYPDDLLPGFGIRIFQGGLRSFVLVYGGNRRRVDQSCDEVFFSYSSWRRGQFG